MPTGRMSDWLTEGTSWEERRNETAASYKTSANHAATVELKPIEAAIEQLQARLTDGSKQSNTVLATAEAVQTAITNLKETLLAFTKTEQVSPETIGHMRQHLETFTDQFQKFEEQFTQLDPAVLGAYPRQEMIFHASRVKRRVEHIVDFFDPQGRVK